MTIFLITLLVYLIGAAATFYYAVTHYKKYYLCSNYRGTEIDWVGVNMWTAGWPIGWFIVVSTKVFSGFAKRMQALADEKQKPEPAPKDEWWEIVDRETRIKRLERELGIK